jgi:hypothetical protein
VAPAHSFLHERAADELRSADDEDAHAMRIY